MADPAYTPKALTHEQAVRALADLAYTFNAASNDYDPEIWGDHYWGTDWTVPGMMAGHNVDLAEKVGTHGLVYELLCRCLDRASLERLWDADEINLNTIKPAENPRLGSR